MTELEVQTVRLAGTLGIYLFLRYRRKEYSRQ